MSLTLKLAVTPGLAVIGSHTALGASTPLTGDWGGERTKLLDQGVTIDLGYVTETAVNPKVIGVQYNAPFPTHPSDTLGIGMGQNHINSRVADNEILENAIHGAGRPVQHSEYVAEIFYGWAPWPFLTLRPNLQYVRHPNGISLYGDELDCRAKKNARPRPLSAVFESCHSSSPTDGDAEWST